jgi:hypothetical protein
MRGVYNANLGLEQRSGNVAKAGAKGGGKLRLRRRMPRLGVTKLCGSGVLCCQVPRSGLRTPPRVIKFVPEVNRSEDGTKKR